MDTENITKIIGLMTESDLTDFEIEQEGLKLRISRASSTAPAYAVAAPQVSLTQAGSSVATVEAPVQDDANVTVIKSPMVGTFYAASSPEAKPFANVGGAVSETSVVCIIEAMKVMNEIHAECSGTITEILVKNGQTVEFGQP